MLFLEVEHERVRHMEGQKSISFVCVNVKAIAQFGYRAEDVFPLQINCAT